jgi:glutamate synthase domain-containing protein 1
MATNTEHLGLYDLRYEHGSCGIDAVVNISGWQDYSIVEYVKEVFLNLRHRGAAGAGEVIGDGVGILFQILHKFLQAECNRLGFFCLSLQ